MIVVGVDGSSPARAALTWSMQRAARLGDAVRLVSVVDDEWGVMGARMSDDLRRDGQRILEAEMSSARSQHPGVAVEAVLLSGNPMLELAAAGATAGLVVVGTHKTGFVRGRIFGSRSLQLAAASSVPVAIVPDALSATRKGIVVGVDGSGAALAAVTFAAREAHDLDTELVLVGAWTGVAGDDASDHAASRRNVLIKSAVEKALVDARARARLHLDRMPRVRQVNRPAAETLIDASVAASMLVIGSSRRTGALTTLGSVAHDVLLNIRTPTVVVHEHGVRPSEDHRQGRGSFAMPPAG